MRARLATCLLVAACATTPPGAPEPVPMRPPERSSIDAVLSHTAELHLTDAQVERLRALDDEREQALADLGIHRPRAGKPGAEPLPPVGSALQRPNGMGRGGMGGRGGFGGVGPGGRGPGGMVGGNPRADQLDPEEQARRDQRRQRIDDADTQAFLRALDALRPEQQEPARRLASTYREALYDFRVAMKKRGLEEGR